MERALKQWRLCTYGHVFLWSVRTQLPDSGRGGRPSCLQYTWSYKAASPRAGRSAPRTWPPWPPFCSRSGDGPPQFGATRSRWAPCQEADTRSQTSPLKPYTTECRWGLRFWGIMALSPVKVNRRFGGTCFMPESSLAYFSALQMEATCSSETSADFQWTTWRYIAEGITLYWTQVRSRPVFL